MKVKILGKCWNLIRCQLPGDRDGDCNSPSDIQKSIRVRSSLTGKREMEVLLHELLHAADWHKDETWVATVASDVAHILWRLGYRKVD